VEKAFNQLFYGDDRTQRVYYPVGDDMAYIQDIHNQDVRTEGMSYGMMIAVQLNRKIEFDRLWKWAKTCMQHDSGPHRGYFAWHCRPDGTPIDVNAASDGEEWFVTALFFAAARWGNGEGLFNYEAESKFILDSMFDKEPDSDSPTAVTNMFNAHEKQVVFVPAGHVDDFTDPSYHLPHFYELWALWDEQRREFWQRAAAASRVFLKKTAHPRTGLTPDYARFDGTPCEAPWESGHADFRFDAWRTAMNIALDYVWFRQDEWAVLQSNRLLEFFCSQGIETYGNQYTLDGKMLSADHSLGLVAMNAVACLAATHPSRRQFVEQLWKAEPPTGPYRYYDGLLYMLALLQVSGTFKIYDPLSPPCSMGEPYVTGDKNRAAFTLCEAGHPAPWCAASTDFPGVRRVLSHVQHDIQRVTGAMPVLTYDTVPAAKELVFVGTLGKNQIIDRLAADGRIQLDGLKGQWETFLIQTIDHPLPGVERALLIVGSDKRGTLFGLYDLVEKIGVSPWHFWADVQVAQRGNLYILPGRHTAGTPKVKYRGIFINDEAPALSGWGYETFGGFNAQFYDKVFELNLRLKGNFLWPAMWGRAFYVDDPANPALADEYGVVISTSHHEPLMRAHAEWAQFGHGPWNYNKNKATLQFFWREGVARMGNYESIVTIGMRGDGDEPMSEEANIALLEEIVRDQRSIIADVTGKPAEETPQVWALYKEVQEYYDKGMRVPDDVTLLLCDDNWGNLRRLPKPDEPPRAGGYGIYYHYDYVGGPRNYKWVNTNQIARVWEQMHLAYRHGVDRIWIVNVGDIKPMEFPISFFLDFAWNPDQWPASSLPDYTHRWVERQFGCEYHQEIAEILTRYTLYNSRRKPELLAPDTYSLTTFREAEQVVNDYRRLAAQAQTLNHRLAEIYRPAYYQLILHPVEACSNLHELYLAVAQNRWYAVQGRKETNALAEKARRLFARDAEISDYFNHTLLNGKWNHMMDQTHIGYTSWQQPDSNVMPQVQMIKVPERAEMGVAI
ncbi:MAG TPA: glycosyl hydrolase family 8, partial [bacterium]|nr:glycosyl hydrolase family 8 [bacterium]